MKMMKKLNKLINPWGIIHIVVISTAVYMACYVGNQGYQNSLENVQEFRVDSSNYPAEYGTGTGGQISVVPGM